MSQKKIHHTDLTRQIASMIQTIDSKPELRAITAAVHAQWDAIVASQCRRFHVGDSVTFDTEKHGQQTGVISRVNLRTLSIDCTDGPFSGWRVSPEYVEKMFSETVRPA